MSNPSRESFLLAEFEALMASNRLYIGQLANGFSFASAILAGAGAALASFYPKPDAVFALICAWIIGILPWAFLLFLSLASAQAYFIRANSERLRIVIHELLALSQSSDGGYSKFMDRWNTQRLWAPWAPTSLNPGQLCVALILIGEAVVIFISLRWLYLSSQTPAWLWIVDAYTVVLFYINILSGIFGFYLGRRHKRRTKARKSTIE